MIDRRIKLRHIESFLAVARTKSLSRAADDLSLTQPAVSKTLIELEDILEAKLVERSRKGCTLTPEGNALLPAVLASWHQLDQAFESVSQLMRRSRMTVRVGVLPTAAASILPPVIARFQERHPESDFQIVSGPNDFLLERLREEELDIVLGRMADPDKLSGLNFTYLYSEIVRFLVRAGHPLLESVANDPKLIAQYPVIMPDPGAIIRRDVDQLLKMLRVPPPKHLIETVGHAFSRVMAIENDAVWVISEGVAAHDIMSGALRFLPIDTSVSLGSVGYTVRETSELSIATGLFIETLMSCVDAREAAIAQSATS